MFSQNRQFRRPDGTLYDPSSFNVRQYEEQYGPGGVPEGWAMGGTTPLQSPGLICVVAALTTLISLGMITAGFLAIRSGEELSTILLGFGVGAGGLALSAQAFRTAVKRRRWLLAQRAKQSRR